MGLFNTSKAMLDAIKGVVADGRKQYAEEEQQRDRLVAEKILSPKQKKIAAVAGDKDKIDAADFASLRAGKKVAEATGNPGPVRKPVPVSFKEKPSKEDMAAWHAKQKVTKEEVESVDEVFSDADAQKQRDDTKDRAWKAKGAANTKKFENNQAASKKKAADRNTKMNGMKEAAERDTPGQHSCAVHVKHSTFGEGKALYSQHAEPDNNGLIEWYDIMFEHGIEKQVPTTDLEVLEAMSHGNHKGKK